MRSESRPGACGESSQSQVVDSIMSSIAPAHFRSGFPTAEPNGADKRSSSGKCSFQVFSLFICPSIH